MPAIIDAASNEECPGANALLEFYFEWTAAARTDSALLAHGEAMAYDPNESSASRYDPTCNLMVNQVLTIEDTIDDLVTLKEIPTGLW